MKPKQNFRFLDTKRKDATKIPLQERQSNFKEIYKTDDANQEQEQSDRCMDCGTPFCQWKCPVHNYIPNWLKLAYQDNLEEAVELCHQTNSLPEVCGRVCPQDRLCEGACTLNDGLGAVTIGSVEKHISDTMLAKNWRPDLSSVAPSNKKVAIVGAGPAGLACADVLIRNGIKSTVFDSYPEIGGLLTFGIPEFKLEKSVLKTRRKFFNDLGIEFQCNTTIGVDIELADLTKQYDAVFLAIGTYKQVAAGLENSNHAVQALDFLIGSISKNMGLEQADYPFIDVAGKNVIVLGGGDTAMDCTRTAIRLGAKSVKCVYRRGKDDMPGSKKEVQNAKEEGVEFIFNRQPSGINIVDGKVSGVQVTTTKTENEIATNADFSDWDKIVQIEIGCESPNANQKLYQVDNSSEAMSADVVLTAFGFRSHAPSWLQENGIDLNDKDLIQVQDKPVAQKLTLQTSNPKVFAGGDIVNGSDLVVTAIDSGRRAADSIAKMLLE